MADYRKLAENIPISQIYSINPNTQTAAPVQTKSQKNQPQRIITALINKLICN
ncbi:hypothetical protein [Snodgrassella alvi]|uniref:hypothetical protein n=1 Tax=Snodgrassella alvi TaxID=1196083 RepID=UPI0015D56747|nr:hypothetical protein [Snodgrassella alvi]